MGYVDYGSPLLVKDKGIDSNEDKNIILSCSFGINSRLTKTEDLCHLFDNSFQLFLSLQEVFTNLAIVLLLS